MPLRAASVIVCSVARFGYSIAYLIPPFAIAASVIHDPKRATRAVTVALLQNLQARAHMKGMIDRHEQRDKARISS
jgi:hypothetical protein